MMRRAVITAVLIGGVACAPHAAAKKMSFETVYQEAIECRAATYGILSSLKKETPETEEDLAALETVQNTESFYRSLSLLLGRKMDRDDAKIEADFAIRLLDWTRAILTSPNAMNDMLKQTKTCSDAISEAEKAQ